MWSKNLLWSHPLVLLVLQQASIIKILFSEYKFGFFIGHPIYIFPACCPATAIGGVSAPNFGMTNCGAVKAGSAIAPGDSPAELPDCSMAGRANCGTAGKD